MSGEAAGSPRCSLYHRRIVDSRGVQGARGIGVLGRLLVLGEARSYRIIFWITAALTLVAALPTVGLRARSAHHT